MNGQLEHWIELADTEVNDRGLEASQQAIMLVGFGAVLKKLNTRVVQLNGKMMGSLLVAIGGGIGAVIVRALSLG